VSSTSSAKLGFIFRRAAVPCALVVVALVQQHRARTLDQSSWIGCGFGMFATLDNHVSRFILPAPDGVAWRSETAELLQRVLVIPTQANLDRLHQHVDGGNGSDLKRMSFYKIEFDPAANGLTATKSMESSAP